MRLDLDAIYALLNYDWWIDNQQFEGGATYQSATVYFKDVVGNYHAYTSTGACPENPDYTIDPTTREYYVKNYLMKDTANYLANGQCAGDITNVEPKAYQPMPIYFK